MKKLVSYKLDPKADKLLRDYCLQYDDLSMSQCIEQLIFTHLSQKKDLDTLLSDILDVCDGDGFSASIAVDEQPENYKTRDFDNYHLTLSIIPK